MDKEKHGSHTQLNMIQPQKDGIPVICNNMDGTEGEYVK
jgi:hypothetical protein